MALSGGPGNNLRCTCGPKALPIEGTSCIHDMCVCVYIYIYISIGSIKKEPEKVDLVRIQVHHERKREEAAT